MKTNGIRCGSPAMRHHSFCYYHTQVHANQKRNSSAEARELPIQLPPLEDAYAIQFALQDIGRAILEDRISDKKAGLLLYLLQTATINLKRMEEDHAEELVRQDYPEAVEEMERLKREAAEDPNEKHERGLASYLLHQLGIHPDDPPQPPPEEKEEEPLWWEVMAGFKPATPNSPQWARRGAEKSVPSSQSPVPSSSEPVKDSSSQPQQTSELPPLKFLSQRVEDIRGVADPDF